MSKVENIFKNNNNPWKDEELDKHLHDLNVARDGVYKKLREYGLSRWECNAVLGRIASVECVMREIGVREKELFDNDKKRPCDDVVGDRHVGLCPFHKEKTPSFIVDRKSGKYHCFGCGRSGPISDLGEYD